MRILGIDLPAFATTGFGVVESVGAKLHYIASGTIKTESVVSGFAARSGLVIFDGVREIAVVRRADVRVGRDRVDRNVNLHRRCC
jgi:crossover junction endodeoxyribonuclease RuvC